MWQADHTPLDVFLLDETGKPAKPWLTVIEDDYSRAIVGYRLGFQEEAPKPQTQAKELSETTGRPRLKRYINE